MNKTIAIASGKGGTGKTTIAVNLARYLAIHGHTVQYLDCDVEEPNGAICLSPIIDNQTAVTAIVPEVDLKRCSGCGRCGTLCQYSAIITAGTTVLTFEQLCHSCEGCFRVCPTGAISEKHLEIGSIQKGTADGIECIQGLLKIGSVRTPSLIGQVKKGIKDNTITIIDAPPGTSCPVIAAIRGVDMVLLVTEPTPFGLHDLTLAVDMTRELEIPLAVIVNRAEPDNNLIRDYCRDEDIAIWMELPDDRRVAELYSAGQLIVDHRSDLTGHFKRLADTILA